MSRSILLVSYFFPPSTDTAPRPATMAKYLRRQGHEVTVLTTSAYGRLDDDREQGVVRTYDLQLARERLRGEPRVRSMFDTGVYPERPHLLSRVLVPEPLVLAWTPFALAAAIRLNRRRRFDCVMTTSPPESSHVVGWALRRRGVPWIADVRDGWCFESLRPAWPSGLQRRLDLWLERRLLRAADAVTCVTRPLVEDVRDRVGARGALVTNGWDPELFEGEGGDPRRALDPERTSVVYTGRFGTYSRDPSALVQALSELSVEEPEAARRLHLLFAGPYADREREMLDGIGGALRVTVLPSLPRPEAIALQRSADALLLLASPARRQAATAKLFEYLGAGKPILALAGGTEAGRIVAETGAGPVVRADDVGAIREAFRRLVSAGIGDGPGESRREYAYPRIAELMAEQIEAAIAR
jgi:glycosyltransferase involved in cell wall biosynthesis